MAAPDFDTPRWGDMSSGERKAAVVLSGLGLVAAAAAAPALPLMNALTEPDRSGPLPSQASIERSDTLATLASFGGFTANVLSVATRNPLPSLAVLGMSKTLATVIRARKAPKRTGYGSHWAP